MNVLKKIESVAMKSPGKKAFHSRLGEITYEELWEASSRLAAWIDARQGDNKKPIVVYGHKHPLMLVCFLACAKSGRAYCPVDTSLPPDRIDEIIAKVDNSLIITTEEIKETRETKKRHIVDLDSIKKGMNWTEEIDQENWVTNDDVFYIIFTSGSTGAPKGVQITEKNLEGFAEWAVNIGTSENDKKNSVVMNQAPFSFDLSVMDMYISLYTGSTLWCLDKEIQNDMGVMLEYMKKGNLNYWVSTPSFAEMCLADPNFSYSIMPEIKAFIFCGETLGRKTAKALRERFPKAKIVNTYGPTESTVAVTKTLITEDLINGTNSLPIGYPKEGTKIEIIKEDGTLAARGEKGEIRISGNTVSRGYFKDEERTNKVFGKLKQSNKESRYYLTGDEGYLDESGMLFYSGRIDLQVKLHGYRIELGDIENNLIKIDGVEGAAVVTMTKDEKIRSLAAFIVSDEFKNSFESRKMVKTSLRKLLPEYMVPKKIIFIDSLPITDNGKVDRKKLQIGL